MAVELHRGEELVVVYATFPDLPGAQAAARGLVEGGLAACVNMIPGMVSVYAWKGTLETAGEVVFLAKTRGRLAEAVMGAIAAVHPYETPALMVLPVEAASRAYGDWIVAETQPGVRDG
ncbi:divalent-cation tolerance protein CutA [Prosthecomicrobium sp. N25]|uniref:divalent-cation tolerance protein CutA n=1 Tax=Prosthecomicrobium sp. N25 TaxID=3129254 RepID=UPI0030774301